MAELFAESECDTLLPVKAGFRKAGSASDASSLLNGCDPGISCDSRVPAGRTGRIDSLEVSSNPRTYRTGELTERNADETCCW
jgi:hypothetical protein